MPTPTYTLLDSVTLASSASQIEFTGISNTYRDLVVVFNPVSTGVALAICKLNSDSSSIYHHIEAVGNGTSPTSHTSTNFTYLRLSERLFTGPSNPFTAIIQIMDYSATDKHKSILCRVNNAVDNTGNNYQGVSMVAGRYGSTSAITSVLVDAGTLDAGTTAYLYGIEA